MMLKNFFNPQAAHDATQARADKLGISYKSLIEIDKGMARFFEAEVHLGDLGLITLGLLTPALMTVAWPAGLLSAWLFATRPQFSRAVEDVAEAKTEGEAGRAAIKMWIMWATMSAGGFVILGFLVSTVLALSFD